MAGARDANLEVFRIRGQEVSRLEALSDAVFALAMTLLIVSVEVPDSFDRLMDVVRGFPAFAVCFAILIWFWYSHYTFCRRFALHDNTTILLNSVLLFVVLFYVYPMKFVFGLFISGILGTGGALSRNMTYDQVRQLFVLYGIGFAAVFGIFALMHVHAYRRRRELRLSPMEQLLTRAEVGVLASRVGLGLLSVAVAECVPDRFAPTAGWVYFLMGATETLHGMSVGRRARMLVERIGQAAATGSEGPPSGTTHPPQG